MKMPSQEGSRKSRDIDMERQPKKTDRYAIEFSNRLKQVMQERDLRQIDLLKLIEPYCRKYEVNISKSHISQYLSGSIYPSLFNFSILCMALGVPMEWLCGIEDIDESEKKQEAREYKSLESRVTEIELSLAWLISEKKGEA